MASDTLNDFTIDGMVGKQPIKLCWIIKQLIENKELPKTFLLLHGKPGNGKTTVARKIAELTGRDFLSLDGPSIVQSYVGQGAQNIVELFNKAHELILQSNFTKRVVIFIDEIDAIASSNNTEFRAEHKSALQQLWLDLDKCKGDQWIFVIFATNHLDKLDKTFLDRLGGNVIELKNPDAQTRQSVFTHYFGKANINVNPSIMAKLVKKTDGLSVRSLEDIVGDLRMMAEVSNKGIITQAMLWDSVKQTRAKFIKTDDPDSEKKLQKISTYISIISGALSSTVNSLYLASLLIPSLRAFLEKGLTSRSF
jgi:SpoVK/Ycf46/Vps4 family AAA+-type ATPase